MTSEYQGDDASVVDVLNTIKYVLQLDSDLTMDSNSIKIQNDMIFFNEKFTGISVCLDASGDPYKYYDVYQEVTAKYPGLKKLILIIKHYLWSKIQESEPIHKDSVRFEY